MDATAMYDRVDSILKGLGIPSLGQISGQPFYFTDGECLIAGTILAVEYHTNDESLCLFVSSPWFGKIRLEHIEYHDGAWIACGAKDIHRKKGIIGIGVDKAEEGDDQP